MSYINQTILFVKEELTHAEAGHDWFHIERVYKNALQIAEHEKCDIVVVKLAALLHDIADSKFHNGDETLGPKKARIFLKSIQVDEEIIEHVVQIIQNMSFKNSFDNTSFKSLELSIVKDADRLDAIGAIGIARTFHYGGYKNRLLYDPTIEPVMHQNKDSYQRSTAPTLNHFYEKLLLLKNQMETPKGIVLAQKRHDFMLSFLAQFYSEWEGLE
jgi:uncharacterized protein